MLCTCSYPNDYTKSVAKFIERLPQGRELRLEEQVTEL